MKKLKQFTVFDPTRCRVCNEMLVVTDDGYGCCAANDCDSRLVCIDEEVTRSIKKEWRAKAKAKAKALPLDVESEADAVSP